MQLIGVHQMILLRKLNHFKLKERNSSTFAQEQPRLASAELKPLNMKQEMRVLLTYGKCMCTLNLSLVSCWSRVGFIFQYGVLFLQRLHHLMSRKELKRFFAVDNSLNGIL